MIMETPERTAFALTDDICPTNPGQCVGVAAIYLDNFSQYAAASTTEETSAEERPHPAGQLVAILITLGYEVQDLAVSLLQIIKVFFDNQSAVGILTINWKDISYRDVIRDITKTKHSWINLIIWASGLE